MEPFDTFELSDAAVEELPWTDGLQPLRSLDQLRTSAPRQQRLPAEALTACWGYPAFRPLQREAIDAALAKRDSVVVLPTGGGKSLCYQVPAACGAGLVLVVSPLIALMDDQVLGATQAGLRAAALHSMLDESLRRAAWAKALAGELDLLYVSPERLSVGDLLPALAEQLALVAIDEAHCISHWGHDFRPEYRQLAGLLAAVPEVPRMALTATATPPVQEDIVAQLQLREPTRLIGHPDRPNLCYRALPRAQVLQQVLDVLARHQGHGAIVYAATRARTEELAAGLCRAGLDAASYHAGLDAARRRKVQSDFVAERLAVVVATVAFGMGIDRSNVRAVIHVAAPRSIEHYQQESGRAGRDGEPADCVLFWGGEDFHFHRQMAERDGPLPPDRKQALEDQLADIGRFCVAPICRHRLLAQHFGFDLEPTTKGCGACDVCLGQTTALAEAEALTTAQKILSAVWRLGGRCGAGTASDLLLGKATARLRERGHDALPTFGLLREAGPAALRAWIDQLLVQGFLQVERIEMMRLIALTPAGVALCRGEGRVRLSAIEARAIGTGSRSRRRATPPSMPAGSDPELFERLRAWRKQVAERDSIPPYVVASDATLRELAAHQPDNNEALLAIRGIGQHKAALYGAALLQLCAGAGADVALGCTRGRWG